MLKKPQFRKVVILYVYCSCQFGGTRRTTLLNLGKVALYAHLSKCAMITRLLQASYGAAWPRSSTTIFPAHASLTWPLAQRRSSWARRSTRVPARPPSTPTPRRSQQCPSPGHRRPPPGRRPLSHRRLRPGQSEENDPIHLSLKNLVLC